MLESDGLIKELMRTNVAIGVRLETAERELRLAREMLADLRVLSGRLSGGSTAVARGTAEERCAEQCVAQVRGLLEDLDAGVLIANAKGAIIFANAAIKRTFEDVDRALPATLDDIRDLEVRTSSGEPLAFADWPVVRLMRGERVIDQEITVMGGAGTERILSCTGGVFRDDASDVSLVIVLSHDVTERREVDQLREEYINLISHDLRVPLTIVMGMADLLRKKLEENDLKPFSGQAAAILRAAKQMNSMIADLVESSRLESGSTVMNKEPILLPHLAADAVRNLNIASGAKRIIITSAEKLPPVLADASQIERALSNLLANALKHSPKDQLVSVRIERVGNAGKISVTDQGSGVPPEEVGNLFRRFYRASNAPKGKGLGLGLYITRLIVESHGGSVGVVSELGKGSTFYISLPLEDLDDDNGDFD